MVDPLAPPPIHPHIKDDGKSNPATRVWSPWTTIIVRCCSRQRRPGDGEKQVARNTFGHVALRWVSGQNSSTRSVPAVDPLAPPPVHPHVKDDGFSTRGQLTAESVLPSIAWRTAMDQRSTVRLGRHGRPLRGAALSSSVGGWMRKNTPPPIASTQLSLARSVPVVDFVHRRPSTPMSRRTGHQSLGRDVCCTTEEAFVTAAGRRTAFGHWLPRRFFLPGVHPAFASGTGVTSSHIGGARVFA